MLTDDILYANVDEGLAEAPDSLKEIYLDYSPRIIMEALLTEVETPIGLYKDLFGLELTDVEQYRRYFFNIPKNVPRLAWKSYIDRQLVLTDFDKDRQNIFRMVFSDGWEAIDCSLNKSRCFSLQRSGTQILKEIFIKMKNMTVEAVQTGNITQMKNILGMVKDGVKVEIDGKAAERADSSSTSNTVQQLQISFVEDIKNSSKQNAITNFVKIDGLSVDNYGRTDTSLGADTDKDEILTSIADLKMLAQNKSAELNAPSTEIDPQKDTQN